MRPCVIVSSRPLSEEMCRFIPQDAFVIAVDAGWQHADTLGVEADLVLGDFDSAPEPKEKGAILKLPQEKDDTDTLYAVKEALRRGYTDVTILGGLGGRLDHTFANMQVLLFIARSNAAGMLACEDTLVYCFGKGSHTLPRKEGYYLSVFAAGNGAKGVCIEGVKYPLQDATILPDMPLGISNDFTQQEATIHCEEGYLYVMLVKKD